MLKHHCICAYIFLYLYTRIYIFAPPPFSSFFSSHRRAIWTALSQREEAAAAGAAAGEGKIAFLRGIWIPFIWFGQNLAWTYWFILGTIMWKIFIFLKIQDGRFRLGKWISLIRFGQNLRSNLAGSYYSTLETSLRKNFLPIAKSKMTAAAAIMANYEIGHNLKSIQVRDPFFS